MKSAMPKLEFAIPRVLSRTSSPSYRFGPGNRFVMQTVRTSEERTQAAAFVKSVHAEKGYDSAKSNPADIYDEQPETRIFMVLENQRPVATLRVVFDSSEGLPSDKVFCDKIRLLRQRQRRVCEIASMALSGVNKREALAILLELFRLAWCTARHIMDANDMIASVMAHHLRFYSKILLFNQAENESRISPRTGRAVCFCALDLETAEQRYRLHYENSGQMRNLYRYFVEDPRIPELIQWLNPRRRLVQSPFGTATNGTRIPEFENTNERNRPCSIITKPSLATLAC